jgi:acid phosphatase (class A)
MKNFSAPKRLLITQFMAGLVLLSSMFNGVCAQHEKATIQPLEPIGKHYQNLSTLSGKPNPAKGWMDTIRFPLREYSRGAISNSLMRSVYLSAKDEADLEQAIRFPANSSDQTRAELDWLLDLQAKRTPEQIANSERLANIGYSPSLLNPTDSLYQQNLKDLFYIGTPVGENFTYETFPAIGHLLQNTMQDIRVTEFRLKRHFMRPRPYHLESRMQNLARMGSPSFPSGHTLFSFTQAYLLGEIIPPMRSQFLELAEEIRQSREILGIHYPSDNEASRILGWKLMNLWMKNPQFQQDLRKAKEEWQSYTKNASSR